MVKAQVYTVAKIFDGEIKESDLKLHEEELPALEDGEYLAESLYLSVDPYMRAYAKGYTIGQVMIGIQVAKIIESKNPKFQVGDIVVGNFGWRSHTIVQEPNNYFAYLLPEIGTLSTSLALGVLGAPGVAAYFGFLDICRPLEGDTVVVSGAAGAVGSHVGQIAKIKGCRVIGITGCEDKARWLESLGFDYVINYKTTKNLAEDLKVGAPKGIDCYFDNVGGDMSTTVMELMNQGGRVSVCGSISSYNAKNPIRAAIVQPAIVSKQLELKGFVSLQFRDRWMEAIGQNLKWVQENKLKYRETITDGFENATKALIGVLKGENVGKAVVRTKSAHVEHESVDFNHALSKFRKIQGL
ncbi:prostaglandin reductase 1 [Tribolium castaneum]|uniref:prostaglandin reductase 1 n=1 Tax=Tribolium castaneum TaxID=7070 RepID=UPI0000D56764|nr:PREDICTED: prostaglandin reductase 1 [Tribolium castaneum]|eukprot:XP_969053.1 PREDICTED: prostaglandin reductase 1 [Tribolium castaneum]